MLRLDESLFEYFVMGTLAVLFSLVIGALTPWDLVATVFWVAGLFAIGGVFIAAVVARIKSLFSSKDS